MDFPLILPPEVSNGLVSWGRQISAVLLFLTFGHGLWKGYFTNFRAYLGTWDFKVLQRYGFFVVGLIVAFLFLMSWDKVIMDFSNRIEDLSLYRGIKTLGDNLSHNVLFWNTSAFLYFALYGSGKKRWAFFLYGLVLSSALNALVAHLLKFIFLRARPYSGLGPYSFFNPSGLFQNIEGFQSLPSGDVAIVAGMAGYLFWALPYRWMKGGVLLLPLSTAFYRIGTMKHWPSDTLVSIGLGLVVGMFVWDFYCFHQRQASLDKREDLEDTCGN